jgi:hypothetical protein
METFNQGSTAKTQRTPRIGTLKIKQDMGLRRTEANGPRSGLEGRRLKSAKDLPSKVTDANRSRIPRWNAKDIAG